MSEETVEPVGFVKREEVNVEPGGREMLLTGGENGVGLLENRVKNRKERALGMEGAGSGTEVF